MRRAGGLAIVAMAMTVVARGACAQEAPAPVATEADDPPASRSLWFLRAGYSPYVASKGALNMLTKQHAVEWAPYGIRVNAISPTFVRTKQVESMLEDESFYTSLINRIPLGRIAEPDDIVGAALFFCSDASAFVTGQILTMDGGLTACQ